MTMPPKRKATKTSKSDQTPIDIIEIPDTEDVSISSSKKIKADQADIHPFFKPRSQQQEKQESSSSSTKTVQWKVAGTSLLVGTYGDHSAFSTSGCSSIAAFDFDDTITTTQGTHVFSKSPSDWKFIHPNVKTKLKELSATHRIVIFSNQKGLIDVSKGGKASSKKKNGSNFTKESIFKGKVEGVAKEVDVPLLVFAALDDDEYRKPRTGMWETFVKDYNSSTDVDFKSSFFVGDAAGRDGSHAGSSAVSKARKDHSVADYHFALNAGLTFLVPEHFFAGDENASNAIPKQFEFDPRILAGIIQPENEGEGGEIDNLLVFANSSNGPHFTPSNSPLISTKQPELLLLVGPPASGKSTFAQKYLVPKGYVHVNQDTLKTKEKCLAAVREALKQGKSVVVDNTNPDPKVRSEYLSAAKSHGAIPVRAFVFAASTEICEHNAKFRAFSTKGQANERGLIPSVVFNTFRSKYKAPEVKEGFAEIKTIHFTPHFESEEHRVGWGRWY
jgi:bifunctional polynucleotide phosphatase/kinase